MARSLVWLLQSAATRPDRINSLLTTWSMLAGTRGVTGPCAARRLMNRCHMPSPAPNPSQKLTSFAFRRSRGPIVAALGGTQDQSPALPASA